MHHSRTAASFLAYLAMFATGTVLADDLREAYARAEALLPQNVPLHSSDLAMRPIWSESGDFFAYIRASEGRRDFFRVQVSSGQRGPLFDRGAVAGALAAACPDRVDPERLPLTLERLAGNGDSIARACGQLWRIPRDGSAIAIDAGNEDDAARSPDGQWDARVRGGNLFLKSRADGREIALTADGTPESFYARPVPDASVLRLNRPYFPDGPADVVWSRDSRRLATYRIDASGAGKLTLVQSVPPEGKRPRTLDYYYPLTGDERVPQARAMTFEVPSGRRVDLAHEPVPILYYGGLGLQWRDDNLRVLFETTDRGRKSVSVIEGSALDGRTRVALREQSGTFVALQWDKWQLVDGWNQYLWIAERDGRPQLQLVDATSGKLLRVLVDGAWSTLSVKHVDRKRGTVFFVGTGRDGPEPYLRRLYSVDRNGGPVRALTTEPVDHDVSLAPDGRHFIDNLSRADLPTRTVLRDARSGRVLRELATANIDGLERIGFSLPEPFEVLAADGETPIYGVIYRPARLDPARRYPVIDNIYTGPHYTMAPKSFERALTGRTANALAQLGFVVVLVDGRGTAGRSRAFIEPAYEHLGSVGLDDHEAAIRALARRYPYMDLSRVGVYGFSAGGFDAARALFHKPDFYKVGVAASGNHDHRSDKAWWNEIWMGFPLGPQYDRESNLTWAGKLQGKLMLAHGELDENVNPMATLQLVDALIDANKDFDLLIVPGAGHFLDESPYFLRRQWDFFVRNLLGAEPPGYAIAPFPPQ